MANDIVPKVPEVHLAFDFATYKAMGEELLTSAKEVSKEAGLYVHAYQQKIVALAQRAMLGTLDPETAKMAIKEYERAMRLELTIVRQKISWDLAMTYQKASSTLINWLMMMPLELIKKL